MKNKQETQNYPSLYFDQENINLAGTRKISDEKNVLTTPGKAICTDSPS